MHPYKQNGKTLYAPIQAEWKDPLCTHTSRMVRPSMHPYKQNGKTPYAPIQAEW
ncbi:predicted protein [Nematostella vectensis]|uniref:Uncharacterized protein n=1 Tax=Nematostella vectensis TaxID=45351 RepID=A7SKG5_NEMVE|nr:predicted protein [Nematostella vectensis]|eukprot:XP_001627865.1 predicted protein [Nematostella vectensis]